MTNGIKRRFKNYENFLTITMFIVFGLVFLDRMAISFIFPYISEDLGMNNTQLGIIIAVMAISFAFSSFIFASISDFIGKKKTMLIAFIFLFSLATFASGLVVSFATLLLVRALMAASEGPVVPLVQSTLLAESSVKRRGFNMGVVQSASSLFGGALAPIIVIGLAIAFDWRTAFYVIAIPGFIVGLILWKYMREPKTDTESLAKPTKKEYLQIFKTRNIWLGMIMMTCNMMWLTTLMAFIPTFLANMTNNTDGANSMLLAVLGFMMFVGQMVGPAVSDKIGRKPVLYISSFIAIFLPIAITIFYNNYVLLLFCMAVFALGNAYQPLLIAIIPGESVSRVFAASAISAIILVGEAVGATTGPILGGVLADQYSLFAPFWVVAGAGLVAFLCSFGMKETAPVKTIVESDDHYLGKLS